MNVGGEVGVNERGLFSRGDFSSPRDVSAIQEEGHERARKRKCLDGEERWRVDSRCGY